MNTTSAPSGYASQLGTRLRNVRQQQELSLHDVEDRSDGELKASVVGAYERGERAVSVARLKTIAGFYGVPVSSLLPVADQDEEPAAIRRGGERLVIDLVALGTARVGDGERQIIQRYVGAIQAQRGDYNGRVLTVRGSDVRALAAVLDDEAGALRERLVELGVARAG